MKINSLKNLMMKSPELKNAKTGDVFEYTDEEGKTGIWFVTQDFVFEEKRNNVKRTTEVFCVCLSTGKTEWLCASTIPNKYYPNANLNLE
jgi:hypothetical protein